MNERASSAENEFSYESLRCFKKKDSGENPRDHNKHM